MKTLFLIIIFLSIPLAAQEPGDTQERAYTFEGTIFEVHDNEINFDETWMQLSRPQVKGIPGLTVTDQWDEMCSISDIQAPCRVELTYIEHAKVFVPIKIKILEYYQCDDDGFILSTHD
jgi:hypothetical protein